MNKISLDEILSNNFAPSKLKASNCVIFLCKYPSKNKNKALQANFNISNKKQLRHLLRSSIIKYYLESLKENTDFKLSFSPKGKPFIEYSKLHFSNSSSNEWFCIAVAMCEIGIDLQFHKDINPQWAKQIGNRLFKYTLDQKKEFCEKHFYDNWSEFEAKVKCIGTGIWQANKHKEDFEKLFLHRYSQLKDYSLSLTSKKEINALEYISVY